MSQARVNVFAPLVEDKVFARLADGLLRLPDSIFHSQKGDARDADGTRPFYDYASLPVFARLPRGLVLALGPVAPAAVCRQVVALFDTIGETVRRNFHPRGKPRLAAANYTRFRKGEQIVWHSDGGANRLAFVFYLNDLPPDRGGRLVFGAPRGKRVRETLALSPTENTLVLFEVPRLHRVEPVLGRAVRHAISGWWTW